MGKQLSYYNPCAPQDRVVLKPARQPSKGGISLIAELASLLVVIAPVAAPPALLLGALSLFDAPPALAQGTPAKDARLSDLTVSHSTSATGSFALTVDLAQAFSAATTAYTGWLSGTRTHVKIIPTASQSGAAITVRRKGTAGATVSSGSASGALSLTGGENVFEVVVTSTDGTATQTYTVTVTRAATFAPPLSVTAREGDIFALTVQLSAPAPDGGLAFTLTPKFGISNLPTATVNSQTRNICHGLWPADSNDVGSGAPTTLTVAAGQSSASVNYPLAKDDIVDLNECFAIETTTTAGGWTADESSGDYPGHTKVVAKTNLANIAFGNAATATARYDLSRDEGSGTVTVPVTVDELPHDATETINVQVVSSSTATEYVDAANPNDFRIVTKSVTFAWNGSKTQNLSVTLNNDDVQEGAEFIQLRFDPASANGIITKNYQRKNEARLTIPANDAPAEVSLSAPSRVVEGSSVTVTARLSAPAKAALTIPVTVSTASPNTAESTDVGSLTSIGIASGATTGTGTITTSQDTGENNETFTVSLGTLPSSVIAGSPASVQITIVDDEGKEQISLGPSAVTVEEGRGFSMKLSFSNEPHSNTVPVPVIVTRVTSEEVVWQFRKRESGDTFNDMFMNTYKDRDYDDEILTVELNLEHQEWPEGYVPNSSARKVTVTIRDLDPVPIALSATSWLVAEGSPVTVRVWLPGRRTAPAGGLVVPVRLTRGSSEEGDHGSLSSITIPENVQLVEVTIPTVQDDDDDNETFTVSLDTGSPLWPEGYGARSDQATAQVTIFEGDTPPPPSSSGGPNGETLLVPLGEIAEVPPALVVSPTSLKLREGGSAAYTMKLSTEPTGNVDVSISGHEGADLSLNPATLTFTPQNWDRPQRVTVTAPLDSNAVGKTVTLSHRATGGGYGDAPTVEAQLQVAADPSRKRSWQIRFGRTISQQVVDALQQRFSTTSTTPSGLQLTLAGEAVTSDTPLEENHVLLSRLLGFERVSSQELAQGSSFSFSPDGAGPRLSFWGKGAFSSFDGLEESITLTGDVTTALLAAEWSNERWRAGAALSHSWGNGSYQGEADGADGRISSSLTGIFPYGRYALTPRLGLWATAGYGWGSLSLNPDGDGSEYNPNTTMALGAVGMDGLLLDGGSEGLTLTTTADALFLKTGSEAVEGLESSEGNISRLRLGLEATRPFPLSNGAALSPSLEVGLRQDSGDAETGFGMDLGAGLSWSAPQHGITATVKGRTLLSHGAEDFQDQGLALSFSWQPSPSNRGASLSLSHAVGLPAEGGMAALLNPTAIEVVDDSNSSGEQFEARLAYGFPFYNNRLTLSPAVALALSTNSRSYSLLWSVAPYAQQAQDDPWQLSLEGERQENLSSSPTVDHSLKLRFALPL